MDGDVLPEPFENAVEGTELREVLPAIDVLVFDVENFLAELLGGGLYTTRFSDTQ